MIEFGLVKFTPFYVLVHFGDFVGIWSFSRFYSDTVTYGLGFFLFFKWKKGSFLINFSVDLVNF